LLALPDPSPHSGKRYNLSGPEDLTVEKILADLSEVLGEKITLDHLLTDDEVVASFINSGLPEIHAEPFRGRAKDFQVDGILQLKVSPTSPEILALAPPTTTFKQFLHEYYKNK